MEAAGAPCSAALSVPTAGRTAYKQMTATGLHTRPSSPARSRSCGHGAGPLPPGKHGHTLHKKKGLSPRPWFMAPCFLHRISESWFLLLFLNDVQRHSRLGHTQRKECRTSRTKLNDHTLQSWTHTRQAYDRITYRKI